MQLHENMLWPAERHKELIAEAQQIHRAARAVREARQEKGRSAGFSASRLGTPERRLEAVGSLPSRRTAWRSAAWRMGHSLVAVGHRLERLGGSTD